MHKEGVLQFDSDSAGSHSVLAAAGPVRAGHSLPCWAGQRRRSEAGGLTLQLNAGAGVICSPQCLTLKLGLSFPGLN
jgi:hypothetical protein